MSQGWARAPATDFHQIDEPKSMSDKSWNGNANVGLESGLDTLPQSSDYHGTPSSPYRVGKPIFPPRTKIGTKQIFPPRTGSGMIVIPTQNLHNRIVTPMPPPRQIRLLSGLLSPGVLKMACFSLPAPPPIRRLQWA